MYRNNQTQMKTINTTYQATLDEMYRLKRISKCGIIRVDITYLLSVGNIFVYLDSRRGLGSFEALCFTQELKYSLN